MIPDWILCFFKISPGSVVYFDINVARLYIYIYIVWFPGGPKFATVFGDDVITCQMTNLRNYFCIFEKNMPNSSRVANLEIVG